MSSLSFTEKSKLEKLFGMSGGVVGHFSNRTFQEFVADAVGLDIYDQKFSASGTSKANRLREFWKLEDDHVVGKLTLELIAYEETQPADLYWNYAERVALFEPCRAIASRLMSSKLSLAQLKNMAAVFDAKHLAEQVRRMEQSVQTDPALAIGTAKELIETCCKTILAERGKPVTGTPDISTLTKDTLKELKLVPEGVPEEAKGADLIRRLLQDLGLEYK